MIKRNIVALAVIAVLIVAGLVYQVSLNRQTASDNDQILTLLETAQNAIERTDPRGTMSVVSRDYKDSAGLTYPVIRMRVTDALRSGVKPDVVLENPLIAVNGRDATVDMHVRVVDRSENNTALINSDFKLLLRKQKLRKHLIFSEQRWQVVSVEGLGRIIETY